MRRILFSLPAVVLAVGVVWAGPVASTSQGTFAGQNVLVVVYSKTIHLIAARR